MTPTDTLTFIYPNDQHAHYDMDYLIDKHLPMVKERWAPYGMRSWTVTKFTPNPEGIPPPYAFSTTLAWDRHESIGNALEGKDINAIMDDVTKFSDKEPLITGKVRVHGPQVQQNSAGGPLQQNKLHFTTIMMDIDGPADTDFAQRTENFLQWFRSLPGATFHNDIQIQDLRSQGAGRSVVATADIEPDTVLFTIPRPAILCAATSPVATHLPSLFQDPDPDADEDDDPSAQDSWTRLILILLHEHSRGPSSPWKPYLDLLPTSFSTPMFWTPSELAALQTSPILPKIGRASADAMIRTKILPVLRAHPSLFPDLPSDEPALLHLAHTVGSAIMAYAFDLTPDTPAGDEEDGWEEDLAPQTTLGLVPLADLLNADADGFNAHVNHGADALTATALRRIARGEEILNYYGPLPTSELLRRYGYVTPAHARHDVVEVPWAVVLPHVKAQVSWLGEKGWEGALARLGEEEDDEVEDSFVLERRVEEPDEEGRVGGEAVLDALPEELTGQVGRLLKAVRKMAPAPPKEGKGLEDKGVRKEICLEAVRRALGDVEGGYGTSLEEDEQLLAGKGERGLGRVDMAVWVRRGEKRLLREAKAWVAKELDEVRRERAKGERDNTREQDSGPSTKRRRV
ncbi:ribosomal lysine N-methyltransferase [Podospora conica]|nr:ribosomal lysine N-methyltransferase [Schizothecium conicum]